MKDESLKEWMVYTVINPTFPPETTCEHSLNATTHIAFHLTWIPCTLATYTHMQHVYFLQRLIQGLQLWELQIGLIRKLIVSLDTRLSHFKGQYF